MNTGGWKLWRHKTSSRASSKVEINKIPSETLTSPKRKLGTPQNDVFPLGLPITILLHKRVKNYCSKKREFFGARFYCKTKIFGWAIRRLPRNVPKTSFERFSRDFHFKRLQNDFYAFAFLTPVVHILSIFASCIHFGRVRKIQCNQKSTCCLKKQQVKICWLLRQQVLILLDWFSLATPNSIWVGFLKKKTYCRDALTCVQRGLERRRIQFSVKAFEMKMHAKKRFITYFSTFWIVFLGSIHETQAMTSNWQVPICTK